jgi:poly(hydroxyalkanoate) depolymerase family esterase
MGASMADFKGAMDRLRAMRQRFEALLAAARRSSQRYEASRPAEGRLQELTGFGANPGNLRMLVYRPKQPGNSPSLVVALHGCSQTAEEYDRGTGWSSLADRLGFVVVYPQQQQSNNPKNCFSWFLPGDTTRGQGEALSIQQMVEHAVRRYGVDRRKVFVTGLSAGGAMAAVMLATYPEIFAGGAIIAGLPYGCARTVQQAFEAMFKDQHSSGRALGDRVRAASTYRGPWPKISIWHGTADPIVKLSNAEGSIRQWVDIHGLSTTPSYQEKVGRHIRRVWNDREGNVLIEAFLISGMAHGVPIGLTEDGEDCGSAGPFFLESGISSTYNIAKFWALDSNVFETAHVPMTLLEPAQNRDHPGGILVATRKNSNEHASDASFDFDSRQDQSVFHDAEATITAAFKAAGLPIPKFANGTSRGTSKVEPAPIIEAALKAAGLRPM